MLTSLKTCWCVFPDRSCPTYDLFLGTGVVGLGFGIAADLRQLPADRAAFKAEYLRLYPELPEASVNQLYAMHFRFLHDVRVGDHVVYPATQVDRCLHIGVIAGDYRHEPDNLLGYVHLRPVRWHDTFPRDTFPAEALAGVSSRLAWYKVRNQLFISELEQRLGDNHGG